MFKRLFSGVLSSTGGGPGVVRSGSEISSGTGPPSEYAEDEEERDPEDSLRTSSVSNVRGSTAHSRTFVLVRRPLRRGNFNDRGRRVMARMRGKAPHLRQDRALFNVPRRGTRGPTSATRSEGIDRDEGRVGIPIVIVSRVEAVSFHGKQNMYSERSSRRGILAGKKGEKQREIAARKSRRNQASAKLMWPRFGATPRVCNMYHRHIWMRSRWIKAILNGEPALSC